MASLLNMEKEAVEKALAEVAVEAANQFGAIVVLKSVRTVVAAPGEDPLEYRSDSPGLGTGGSGDVLAGVIGGLMARGAGSLVAAAWGVWLHGEAGKNAAQRWGPIGFLARELPALLPRLLAASSAV
jgi:NAD(P)H-hydrate repair Nnr-like enzyme with NAD(P)H-hydrate dehydratase domain